MPKRLVLSMSMVLLVLGVASGVMAHFYFEFDHDRQLKQFAQFAQTTGVNGLSNSRVDRVLPAEPDQALVSQLRSNASTLDRMAVRGEDGILVERVAFQQRAAANHPEAMTRFEGDHFGLDEPYAYSVLSQATVTRFRGIATGDVHNDGWIDILLTTDSGVSLYANKQGKGFVLQQCDIPAMSDLYVVNAALVDLNNDGWLDIFLSSYRGGNYLIYNEEGRFTAQALQPVPNQEGAVASAAAAFGDIDKDGDLDIALGNWSLGVLNGSRWAMRSSRDALLTNHEGQFEVASLDGVVGEALSALLSDFNGDGNLDLIIGNDVGPPDNFYLGDGRGALKLLTRGDSVIPHSAATTMSITTADVDNDLAAEIYIAQISGRTGDPDVEIRQSGAHLCAEMVAPRHKQACETNQELHANIVKARRTRGLKRCLSLDERYRDDCVAVLLLAAGGARQNQDLCKLFPAGWEIFAFFCNHSFEELATATPAEMSQSIRQRGGNNVLLVPKKNGRFVDEAELRGVNVGGWSWNAKFADLDNDEWQDLFVVNGPEFLATRESNLFYHNNKGKTFLDNTEEWGLGSYLETSAYSYVDLENDGDLDIVVIPIVGPVLVYLNNTTRNSIAFELRDQVGNHFGIGSKVIVHYGADPNRQQMREIQAGGGFVSFDAPIAYFGLGEFDTVRRVEILWSTGERSELQGEFQAGAKYRVTRRPT